MRSASASPSAIGGRPALLGDASRRANLSLCMVRPCRPIRFHRSEAHAGIVRGYILGHSCCPTTADFSVSPQTKTNYDDLTVALLGEFPRLKETYGFEARQPPSSDHQRE
jgi:hypothetical protein